MRVIWFTYSYGHIFIFNNGRIWYNIPSFLADLGHYPTPYTIRRINLYEHYENEGQTIQKYDETKMQEEVFSLCDNFTLKAFNDLWTKASIYL